MKSNLDTSRGILTAVALGALLWGAICACARADSHALQPFGSLEDAATAALTEAEGFAPGYEAGGTIYQCGSKFAYYEPVTQHKRDGLDVPVYQNACALVAYYHTHPKGDSRFSATDITNACKTGVLSFIKPAGSSLRVFDCRGLPKSVIQATIRNDVLSRGRSI